MHTYKHASYLQTHTHAYVHAYMNINIKKNTYLHSHLQDS